jgi:acetylglutamate kinase
MIVVKYGGHALPTAITFDENLKIIATFHKSGKEIVLVHGGGPQVDAELAVHGIQSEMIAGYRATTPAIMEIVQSILSGQVCRTLVNQLISFGANAVGLSASDGRTVRARQYFPVVDGEKIDIGLVGEVEDSDGTFLRMLVNERYLPVVSPVATSNLGQALNLNGDIAAGAIGGSLKADEVIFMTDVPGIYRDFPHLDSFMERCSADDLRKLLPTFSAGMIPKATAALYALDHGAKRVRIIDGRDSKNLISALDGIGGTVVTL